MPREGDTEGMPFRDILSRHAGILPSIAGLAESIPIH